MNIETEIKLVKRWQRQQLNVLEEKQSDYARPEDVLWNFESRHLICSILDVYPGARECDVYINDVILKLQRLCNLLHAERRPKNEPVDDTIGDMINYATLLRLHLAEGEKKTKSPLTDGWPDAGIWCGSCGAMQTVENRVSYTPDPLIVEVDEKIEMRWLCARCWCERHDEI